MPANINFILYTNDGEALVERTTTDLSWIFLKTFCVYKDVFVLYDKLTAIDSFEKNDDSATLQSFKLASMTEGLHFAFFIVRYHHMKLAFIFLDTSVSYMTCVGHLTILNFCRPLQMELSGKQ